MNKIKKLRKIKYQIRDDSRDLQNVEGFFKKLEKEKMELKEKVRLNHISSSLLRALDYKNLIKLKNSTILKLIIELGLNYPSLQPKVGCMKNGILRGTV